MKVLIVGSKGMLGQEFLRQLPDAIGWDRNEMNITRKDEVFSKIRQLKPDLIINCAAYNAVDKAEAEPEAANLINGEAVGYLAAAAAGSILVHFSTDYVFDGSKAEGYVETDLPNPISKYGESKLLGEKNLSGNFYLIRTSKLFGLPGIGENCKKSFPEMMLGLARKNGKIEAIDDEIGSPTYVKDLVQAVLKIVADKMAFGIYHLTNSGFCTWYEYAKAAVECAGMAVEVIPVGQERFPRPARRPSRVVLLNTKLPPLRPWPEALKEFLQAV